MFYHPPSLKDFVCPVPVCQLEAGLDDVVSIFRHLNCKVLAIPLAAGWGIITAEKLLYLITKICWNEKTALVAGQRNICERKAMERSPFELQASIESVVIDRDDTKLDDFLNSPKSNDWLAEEKVCLIIDAQGTLQGRLDRSKIIEYLAHTKFPANRTNWLSRIALPAKIETASGRTIQTNQRGLDLSLDKQKTVSTTLPTAKANLEHTRQWSSEQKQGEVLEPKSTVNSVSDPYSLGIELEQTADWNYLKIPLTQLQTRGLKDTQYLVLATPTMQLTTANTEQIAVTSKMTSDRILTTVSHDLKSPLTGILGLSSLLQEQKLGSLNQRQLRYVKLIYRSGKKMMNIVDRLLRLNTLTAEQSSATELINLEFLCRHLYQETVAKLHGTKEYCHLAPEIERTQLDIELGSEIAIANKPLLSAVLSHLLLEAFEISEFEPLRIAIENCSGSTKIKIASQKKLPETNLGLNWMMAECLSESLHAQLTHTYSSQEYQFILLLPKSHSNQKQLPSLLATAPQVSSRISKTNLTILCLYPELDVIDPSAEPSQNYNFNLKNWSDDYEKQTQHQHRIIEADSLEQAHNLARIWQLDAIVLNGALIALPDVYLQSLQEYEHLANLPLITLDARTTEAANQKGLNVYPCLLSAQQRNLDNLVQAIEIAIET